MYVELLILNRDLQDEVVVIQVGKTKRENTISANTSEVAHYPRTVTKAKNSRFGR